MKRLLATLLLPLAFLACSTKKDSPAPDAGTAVAGEYQLNRVASFSNDQPVYDFKFPQTDGINTRTGTLVITRNTETTVYVSAVQTAKLVSGPTSTTTSFGKMDVKMISGGFEFSQYDKNQQKTGTGITNGNAVNIELSDTYQMVTTRYVLEAKR